MREEECQIFCERIVGRRNALDPVSQSLLLGIKIWNYAGLTHTEGHEFVPRKIENLGNDMGSPSNFEISMAINVKSDKIVNSRNSSSLTARSRNVMHT